MPYARPTLTDLFRQSFNDLQTGPGADGMGLLRWAVSRPLSWALANTANGQYGYLDWIARQSNPFTCRDEFLDAWAGLVGIRRKPAQPASGAWSGTGNPGAVLQVGSRVARADGASYLTLADAAVAPDGTIAVAVMAELPGSAGNGTAGMALLLAAGTEGVNSAGTASTALTGGADPEQDDPLRTRMLLRWSEPPQGGNATDYRTWALAVPGVTRAWVLPRGMGVGTVLVYTMRDLAGTDGFPVGRAGVAAAEDRDSPATGDLLAVADALLPLQPVTALVYSVAPLPYAVPFGIQTRLPVQPAQKAAAAAALDAVFIARADPLGGTIALGPFDTGLAAALGTDDFTLLQPNGPIAAPVGRLPVRGALTWTLTGG